MWERLIAKPYERAIKAKTISDEVVGPIMSKILAECIVLDWRSDLGPHKIAGETGDPLEYSRATCEALLIQLPELQREVQNEAAKMDHFLAELAEEDQKN